MLDDQFLMWWITLALGLVVTLVAALLLVTIINDAKSILQGVSRIWDCGQRVANNTIHIPILQRSSENLDICLRKAVNCINLTKPKNNT
jgi:hypothetical protein|tara:strand:+ start:1454 stop:1720 length:267 start_codon:yes stop_codon:yes gene_type:complete